jgi:hypothetical protein
MQASPYYVLLSMRSILLNLLTSYLTADSEFLMQHITCDLILSLCTFSFTSRDGSSTMGSNETTEPTSLTIRILQEITDNFSEERALGQGAYGKVYKVKFTQSILVFLVVKYTRPPNKTIGNSLTLPQPSFICTKLITHYFFVFSCQFVV